jgi:hypothetical protein
VFSSSLQNIFTKKPNSDHHIASSKKQILFYTMNTSTLITGGPPVVPAARSGLTDLKNVYGHDDGKDGDSPATNYGYGDDSDSEDDSPGGAYGYGGSSGLYGYGGNATPGGAYGYGDDDNKGGGGDDDKDNDYGYGEDADAGNPACDYGYGDDDAPTKPIISDAAKPVRPRPRLVRRNSCLIRKEDNPLAVAEYLLGGPPPMSDRDMDALELNNEGAISA